MAGAKNKIPGLLDAGAADISQIGPLGHHLLPHPLQPRFLIPPAGVPEEGVGSRHWTKQPLVFGAGRLLEVGVLVSGTSLGRLGGADGGRLHAAS